MQRYIFEKRIPMFELEDPRRGREILEHAKRLLYNDAQEKIKELLETGECYSFQVTLVQSPPIDDFAMNARIVLRLETQRTTFMPQGVAAPPPYVPLDPLVNNIAANADAFQVGQQYAGQRIGERIAEQVDEMARNAFVGGDPATPGGDYGIGEMWRPRRDEWVYQTMETKTQFERWLIGPQHEARKHEDVWSDFPDAEIEAYDFFR